MAQRHVIPHDPKQPPFIERVEQVGHLRIVRLRGAINQDTVEQGYEYILQLRRGETIQGNLLLDCAKVERVDFAAVALLIVRMQDYLAKGHSVSLLNVDLKMRTYLELAELGPRVRVFDTEEQALRDLTGEGADNETA